MKSERENMMATIGEQKPINTNYEIFILALSVLSIFNVIVELLPIDQDVKTLVEIIDVALTPIFLFDLLSRLVSAPSKKGIPDQGWRLAGFYRQPAVPRLQDRAIVSYVASFQRIASNRGTEHMADFSEESCRERVVDHHLPDGCGTRVCLDLHTSDRTQ